MRDNESTATGGYVHSVHQITLERDDNGWWLVRCPALQGTHSHGRTLSSARANIREAIALVLDLDDVTSVELVEDIRSPNN